MIELSETRRLKLTKSTTPGIVPKSATNGNPLCAGPNSIAVPETFFVPSVGVHRLTQPWRPESLQFR